jgi:osmotically-inducible protein OsmY
MLLAAAGTAGLALQGCELAVIGAAGAVYSVAEDRRSPGTQLNDETIQIRANNRITERYGDRAHVTVTSFNHMVLLTGEVPDQAMRDEVGRIVQAVPNVRAVANEIELALPSTRASRLNDEVITTKVKGRLINSGKVNPVHAKVVTEAGVVYLLGVVTQAEAEAAVSVARTTGGVRKVVKIFEYCRAGDATCRPHDAPAPLVGQH